MIKAVYFDFGNVLATVDRDEICAAIGIHSPLTTREIEVRIFGTDIEWDSETGRIDSHGHFNRIKSSIDGEPSWTYEQFAAEFPTGLHLNEEGISAMKFAGREKRVFILSNTSYVHSLWLYSQEPLATLPEGFVFSFKVGVMKPDPEIWLKALSMHSLDAQECIYIDDIPEFCSAAEDLGFSAIHYAKGQTDLRAELQNRF